MALGNAIKYMVEVDSKGAVTGIKAAADAADQGGQKFKLFDTVLKGVQIGMGLDIWGSFKNVIVNAVQALPALIGKTGEYAGQLLKTNSGLRLTVEAQQMLMRAGQDVGVSWEAQSKAIRTMQLELAKAPESVSRLGLDWKDLKNLAPEKQYEAIGTAIAGIEDPVKRTQAATDYFGKSATEVLGVFEGAIQSAREANEKFALSMSKETALAVDRLSDNIELGGKAIEGWGRNFVGAIAASEPLQIVVEAIMDGIGYFSRAIKENQSTIAAWVTGGVVFALNALLGFGPVIGAVIDAFAGLKIMFAAIVREVKDVAAALEFAATAALHPIDATTKLFATLKENSDEFNKSVGSAIVEDMKWQASLTSATVVVNNLTEKVEKAAGATNKASEATKNHTKYLADNSKAVAAAAKAEEDAWLKANVEIANDMAAATKEWQRQYKQRADESIAEVERILAEEKKLASEEVQIAIDAHRQIQQNWAEFGKSVAAEQERQLDEWANKWLDIAATIGAVGDIFETMGFRGAQALHSISEGLGVGTQAAVKYATATTTAAKAMVVAETAAYAMKAGVLAGAAAGAQLGFAMGGPLGAGIGAAAGALLGWIGKAARAREEAAKLAAQISQMRTEFISSAGGIAALELKAKSAGLTLDKLFNAKTVKDYQAAVDELTRAIDGQKAANEALDAAMEKYGITIDQLGPKFAQQRLDEQAMALLKDYELLIAAGVDMTVVIEKMGPAFNTYVQTAMAAGATLPESLRPIIEKMIELGLLTDAAGNKIESIDGIKFAPTVTDAIVAMTNAIKELVNWLRGIPDVDYSVTEHRRVVNDGGGDGNGGGDGIPNNARGGIYPARPGGVIARVAEAGQSELVAPVRAFSSQLANDLARVVGAGGGGGGDIYIMVDPSSGSARELSPSEARRIQSGMGRGLIKVPVRASSAQKVS